MRTSSSFVLALYLTHQHIRPSQDSGRDNRPIWANWSLNSQFVFATSACVSTVAFHCLNLATPSSPTLPPTSPPPPPWELPHHIPILQGDRWKQNVVSLMPQRIGRYIRWSTYLSSSTPPQRYLNKVPQACTHLLSSLLLYLPQSLTLISQ